MTDIELACIDKRASARGMDRSRYLVWMALQGKTPQLTKSQRRAIAARVQLAVMAELE